MPADGPDFFLYWREDGRLFVDPELRIATDPPLVAVQLVDAVDEYSEGEDDDEIEDE